MEILANQQAENIYVTVVTYGVAVKTLCRID
jgi:hypothetical protein